VLDVDAPPTYDTPPTIEDLFRGQNRELDSIMPTQDLPFSRRRDESEWRPQWRRRFKAIRRAGASARIATPAQFDD
jgi:hypothetical protein